VYTKKINNKICYRWITGLLPSRRKSHFWMLYVSPVLYKFYGVLIPAQTCTEL